MMTDPDMKKLENLLADVAGQDMPLSDDLVARVLADAVSVQGSFTQAAMPVERPGMLARILSTIGGWPGLSGLAAAGVAGLWIGVAPPVGLESIAANVLGTSETIDAFGLGFSYDVTEAFDG